MPLTYEYRCDSCHYEFEVSHGMNDAGPTTCPSCDAHKSVSRVISGGSGFLLTGGGWYKDGYKSNKPAGTSG